MDLKLNLGLPGQGKTDNNDRSAPQAAPAKPDSNTFYDILIIGGGPAGLNAGLYAVRKGLKTLIIAERAGGQTIDTSEVDNYIGLPGENGFDLAMRYVNHVKAFDVPILEGSRALKWHSESPQDHQIQTSDGQTFRGRTVLIATGSVPRKLMVPGEDLLNGRGVSYCAICDGPFFRNRPVAVAGGGNAAIEAAIDLAKMSSQVTVIQRSRYRADKILLDQADALPNIKRLDHTQITGILGSDKVEGLLLHDKRSGESYEFPTNAVFVEIGHNPTLGPFTGIIETSDSGEIVVDRQFRTSLPGVYAAGDVTTQPHKQIIVAAAEGAAAALVINSHLNSLAGQKVAAAAVAGH